MVNEVKYSKMDIDGLRTHRSISTVMPIIHLAVIASLTIRTIYAYLKLFHLDASAANQKDYMLID